MVRLVYTKGLPTTASSARQEKDTWSGKQACYSLYFYGLHPSGTASDSCFGIWLSYHIPVSNMKVWWSHAIFVHQIKIEHSGCQFSSTLLKVLGHLM